MRTYCLDRDKLKLEDQLLSNELAAAQRAATLAAFQAHTPSTMRHCARDAPAVPDSP